MTQPLPKTYQTIRWTDDADPNFVDTESDLESLEQDCLHVIMQIAGSNLDDPDRGVNAEGYLGGTNLELAKMPHLIDTQFEADARISSSATTLVQVSASPPSFLIQSVIQVGGQVVNLNYKLGPGGISRV
jgi:hypothetical protein